ncbi:hypothetical protein F4780DRAFT_339084 [Xylariomycetidae sp. FL0641]|nr:hypothetical protein F4780DRAFT_339084 [Xylariomycetidae sp. FL0641]
MPGCAMSGVSAPVILWGIGFLPLPLTTSCSRQQTDFDLLSRSLYFEHRTQTGATMLETTCLRGSTIGVAPPSNLSGGTAAPYVPLLRSTIWSLRCRFYLARGPITPYPIRQHSTERRGPARPCLLPVTRLYIFRSHDVQGQARSLETGQEGLISCGRSERSLVPRTWTSNGGTNERPSNYARTLWSDRLL